MTTNAVNMPEQPEDPPKERPVNPSHPTIEELVGHCIKGFERVKVALGGQPMEQRRFHDWTSRVDAKDTDTKSLQYRLRKSSELTTKTQAYLTEIRDALHDQGNAFETGRPDKYCSSKGNSGGAAILGFGKSASKPTKSQSLTIKKVGNAITSLERMTPALLKATKDAEVGDADSIKDELVYRFCFKHIRAQFGTAQEDVVLTLASALSRNRRYFAYLDTCHMHAERPQAGSSDGIEQHIEYTPWEDGPRKIPEYPPLPLAGANQDLFECPFCYNVIQTLDEHSWRCHIREDLFPFTCTATYCKSRGVQFARLSDLAAHYEGHPQSLNCPFQCSSTLQAGQALMKHMSIHRSDPSYDPTESNVLQYYPMLAEELKMNECPLCFEKCKDMAEYLKHIGAHMERLALFSLPSRSYIVAGDSKLESQENNSPSDLEPAPNVTRKHRGPVGDMLSKLHLK